MNINDIAKMAEVSRATVSRYLNDGYVSEEKRERIRKVIEETGYTPSRQAQILRTNKTRVVGVIIPKIDSDSISRMVEGISSVLSKAGYQLLLANTHNHARDELDYLQVLENYHVDGIILLGTVFSREHKKRLWELDIPVVVLAQQLPGFACVYNDDYRAALEMTRYMLDTAKHPGCIGVTHKDKAAGEARWKGFYDACKKKHMAWNENAVIEAEFTIESGYEKAAELFARAPETDTLFCATDRIAYGAVKYLREQGRKVPEEVQVAGVGDSTFSHLMEPELTTVHYYFHASGMEAANMLLELMDGKEEVVREIRMGHRLEIRQSTRRKEV